MTFKLIIRIGNYTVAPNNDGWCVFDWSQDQDISWYASRKAAVRHAKRLNGGVL